MDKPVIAITMGDPAGIGPELIVKVLAQGRAHVHCCPFVVGDLAVMHAIGRVVGAGLRFRAITSLPEARFTLPEVDVLPPEGLARRSDRRHASDRVRWGQVDPAMGRAAALCLREAFALALADQVQGVVSAPLNKEAFHLAGYPYPDELAYLADLTGSREPFIMGVMGAIWTVAVTEHIPFRQIAERIKKERVLWHIARMHQAMKRAGVAAPRIAVAALNVHAGEGGLFGREEIDEIGPAIQQAREQGIDARGPIPADMVFVRAMEGDFDGVVCMYHDQANIARKLQPKSEGATLFMGLPVPCGTTAHGTAFDKAGRGIADPGSLEAALRHTIALASRES